MNSIFMMNTKIYIYFRHRMVIPCQFSNLSAILLRNLDTHHHSTTFFQVRRFVVHFYSQPPKTTSFIVYFFNFLESSYHITTFLKYGML